MYTLSRQSFGVDPRRLLARGAVDASDTAGRDDYDESFIAEDDEDLGPHHSESAFSVCVRGARCTHARRGVLASSSEKGEMDR
jgi:hypothetical protein